MMTKKEAVQEIKRLKDGILLAKRILSNHDCNPGCDGCSETTLEHLEKLTDTTGQSCDHRTIQVP